MEPCHGRPGALAQNGDDGLRGSGHQGFEIRLLIGAERTENMIDHRGAGAGTPDAHAKPNEIVTREGIHDGSYSFVSPIPPFLFDFYSSECKVEVIVNNHHILACQAESSRNGHQGRTAAIHISQRLGQYNGRSVHCGARTDPAKPFLGKIDAQAPCQGIGNLKADVVPGAGIIRSGIAEPRHQPQGRSVGRLNTGR